MAVSAMTEPRRLSAPAVAGVTHHSPRPVRRRVPAGAGGIGADIACRVLFLAADAAHMITAQEFVVDAGRA
jgi:hypothetical protein